MGNSSKKSRKKSNKRVSINLSRRRHYQSEPTKMTRPPTIINHYVYVDGDKYDEPEIDGVVQKNSRLLPENLAKRRANKERVKLTDGFLKETLSTDINTLVREFCTDRQAAKKEEVKFTANAFEANQQLNRHKTLQCWDQTRVILKDWPHDYINANYVAGHENPHKFICTQDPLPDTIADFWHMVVQEKAKVIFMIYIMKKVDQYYPSEKGQTMQFGKFTVTATNIRKFEHVAGSKTLVETDLEVKIEGKDSHTCTHLHWPDWSYENPPTDTPINIYERLNTFSSNPNDPPIVVHCIDGALKTGPFVLIATMLEQLKYKLPWEKNIRGYVGRLRTQRNRFVRTQREYIYVYMVLVHYIVRQCMRGWEDADLKKEWQTKYYKFQEAYRQFAKEHNGYRYGLN